MAQKLKKIETLIGLALFEQMERQGKEVKRVIKKSRIVQAMMISPLDRLRKKDVITSQEFAAGKKYGEDFELSNKTNHARPSYDGTTVSGIRHQERTINQQQLCASKRVEKAKQAVAKEDMRLLMILELVFEKEKSINNVEAITGINHSLIEKKTKLICDILVKN
jgi:hypothetical protein